VVGPMGDWGVCDIKKKIEHDVFYNISGVFQEHFRSHRNIKHVILILLILSNHGVCFNEE